MRVYVEAKLPELCLPIEAVFWLAFGRAPEIHLDEWGYGIDMEEPVDYRLSPNVVGDTYPDVDEFPLPEELAATGHPVDEAKYLLGVRPERAASWIDNEVEKEAMSYAKEMQKLVSPLLDECKAEVFLALRNGKLRGRAFRWADEEARSHFFEDIPADYWTLSLLVDEPARFDDAREGYACIYVLFEDVLSTFPTPKGVTNPETGERTVFSTVLDEKISPEVKSSKPRGAPQKGDGIAKAAVRAEMSRLSDEGRLSGKKEADIQYAIEWSEKNLSVSVSRSSMQRWIGDILGTRP